MKFIVNFSGGLCSFWAAHRKVQKHGAANVVLLFADVLIESLDLYIFNRQASAILGAPITRVSREMTPWQLFRKEGMIGNNRAPICSIRLKREPLNEWMETNYELHHDQANALYEPATIVLGMDWTEAHRLEEFRATHPTWTAEAPMTEEPIWDKCKMLEETQKLGLIIPEAYKQGFPHNNCGKRCVRAGISHFVRLYFVDHPAYMEWENEELETQRVFAERGISNGHFTILKDRRGGVTKPLSLRSLRLRIEAGEKFPTDDWGGCGCGVWEETESA